jgi:hypothetical protein
MVEMEAVLALLESAARGIGPQPDDDAVARSLIVRYTVQDELPRIASRALELLGGLDFISTNDHAAAAAAVRALAFHPPARAGASDPMLRYFAGGPLELA